MNKIESPIKLGPLLGAESGDKLSICILANKKIIKPVLEIIFLNKNLRSQQFEVSYSTDVLNEYTFFRFSFNAIKSFQYRILENGEALKNIINSDFWKVIISDEKFPNVAFASCSGTDKRYPNPDDVKEYLGWNKLLEEKPDYLFLTGDQIYSDVIRFKIPDTGRHMDVSRVTDFDLESFFVELYIDSWSNPAMNKVLSTIPNVMTWDDHDIIDGYGSYDKEKNNSLSPIFNVARKYYHLFQLRGVDNDNNNLVQTAPGIYNQYLKLSKFHFILPDTRSNRTISQVLDSYQYNWLENFRTTSNIVENDIIVLVLPVPIAHLSYFSFIDRLLMCVENLGLLEFYHWYSDETKDQWAYSNHRAERELLLNLMFEIAEKKNVKHLVIVSGDVHCAGASTIMKMGPDERFATQLVSSPIVNKPYWKYLKYLARKTGMIGKDIGYVLNDYGNLNEKLIDMKNFLILRASNGRIIAELFVESNKKEWNSDRRFFRNINNFILSRINEKDKKKLYKMRQKYRIY